MVSEQEETGWMGDGRKGQVQTKQSPTAKLSIKQKVYATDSIQKHLF